MNVRFPTLRRFFLVAALVSAVAAGACAPADPPPSVIVIVIDTLRADHLGMYGYQERPTSPRLDERAASAAVFNHAFSTAPWTLPAFGSLLTGQLPTRHSAGVIVEDLRESTGPDEIGELVTRDEGSFFQLDASLPTLASVLQESGYSTSAIVNNAFLSPEFGVDRGFEDYDYDRERPQRTAAEGTDRAIRWLQERDENGNGEAPFFMMVHYFDPHMPYAAPAPFFGSFSEEHVWDELEWPVTKPSRLRYPVRDQVEGWERYAAVEQSLYDEEIAYVDQEIERLLASLDERGFWDNGYLVLTSDHGEEFNDHGWSEHGHTVYNELIRVPLIVWGPTVRPGNYDLPVSIVDVMPTILEAVGAEAETELEGVSLLQALQEGPASRTESVVRFDRPLISERVLYGDEKKSLIRWPWKIFADIEDSQQVLFDLENDFGEQSPTDLDGLDAAGKDRLLTMLAQLQLTISEAGAFAPGPGASLSEETLRTLRNLGYIR